jgi:hypothetical protein
MRRIYIGLSRHTDFAIFGRAIEWFEKTNFSHAYVRFYSESLNRSLIYQASGMSVNFTNIEHFNSINTTVKEYEILVSDEQYTQILQFCVDNVSKPYGLKSIFGILVYQIFGWKCINPDKQESFICSELVCYILQMLGIINEPDLDYSTPKSVYNILNAKR